MTDKEVSNKIAARPETPKPGERTGSNFRPYELDPELAQTHLAELMIKQMGTPSDVSAPFIVRHAIFKTLNHIPPKYRMASPGGLDEKGVYHNPTYEVIERGNITGLDCSLRLGIYHHAEAGSINKDGHYFNNFWAYLMKPKYIINGMSGQQNPWEKEEGESIVGRVVNWFRGKPKEQTGQAGSR